jgi:hypothetical protein
MLKFTAGLVAGIVLLGLFTHTSRGQGATANMKAGDIRQGDTFAIDLTIDKAPNLDGGVYVGMAPDGGEVEMTSRCNLPMGTTTCRATATVALGAKTGKWSIAKFAFQPAAGGPEKELTKHGDLSFRIVARTDVIEPDSATVTAIK